MATRQSHSTMCTLIIGMAGGTGSGKTTIARRIADGLAPARAALVDMDAYYRHRPELSFEERKRLNWDHPDALDIDLFVEHLDVFQRTAPWVVPRDDGEISAERRRRYARHPLAARAHRARAAPPPSSAGAPPRPPPWPGRCARPLPGIPHAPG